MHEPRLKAQLLIDRRIGGLEICVTFALKCIKIDRRIGGLESARRCETFIASIDRRIGGLETYNAQITDGTNN